MTEGIVKTAIKSVKDLKVYQMAYKLAMDIFEITKKFPKEETYSLTDQIRRSSRSVAINIREGFAKRKYEQIFIRHLNDALGSSEETRGWLKFSLDSKYILKEEYEKLDRQYDEVNNIVNLSLCKGIQEFQEAYYPDNTGIPALTFKGCDIRWIFPNENERQKEIDRIMKMYGAV